MGNAMAAHSGGALAYQETGTPAPDAGPVLDIDSAIGELPCHACSVDLAAPGHDIDESLRNNPELPGCIVTDGSDVVGVVSRQRWLEELSQPFRAELYLNHPVARAVVSLSAPWLCLASATLVHDAVRQALARPRKLLFEPLMVDFPDGQHRLLDTYVLLMAQSEIFARARERSEALRHDVESYAQQLERTVADLRATQDSLVEARRLAALARLVAGMAHEINTPVGIALTAVTHLEAGLAQLQASVAEGHLRRSEMTRFLEMAGESVLLARSNVQRTAELIRSFKRVAVDQTSEVRRRFNLADYLGEVLHSLRPVLKRQTHQVRVDCPPDIVLDSYPGALAQIFTNLTMNALEHAFPENRPGTISIACSRSDSHLHMVFSDDGVGISESDQVHLFEPFFTTRGHAGGSGLGLHIVFNLVTGILKGTVACQSQPGLGTSFVIDLPLEVPQ